MNKREIIQIIHDGLNEMDLARLQAIWILSDEAGVYIEVTIEEKKYRIRLEEVA